MKKLCSALYTIHTCIKMLTWKLEVWVFIHLSHAWKKTAKHLFLSKGLLTSKPKETWNLYNLYINCSLLQIKPCLWKIIHFHTYLIHFPKIVDQIVIFYTEILTGKVVLWCFFSSETSEISTIQLFKSKSQFFSNEMEKKPKYYTYFSIEFGKVSFFSIILKSVIC